MARRTRMKLEEAEAWYHIHARTAGCKGEFPLDDKSCREELIALLRRYGFLYQCDIAAFCVMGNHYHAVVRFDEFKTLSRGRLMNIALGFYPDSREMLDLWTDEEWEHFNKRIFDVSEFMRNVQAAFATWYNRTFERRGRFWADRFKSTLLESGQAVLDCMLYVDLNPVRAGIVKRPEEHKGASIYLRQMQKGRWLIPFRQILGDGGGALTIKEYRCLLYHRGAVPTKEGQQSIPESILQAEEARGFKVSGVFKKRLRHFADGMVLGSEGFVNEQLSKLKKAGHYLRRKNTVKQLDGAHTVLREQRSHAVEF